MEPGHWGHGRRRNRAQGTDEENLLHTAIPQAVAKKAGIRNGQSVRFEVRDGDIVISPTGVPDDSAPDSTGPGKVERVIAEMMAKDRPKGPDARGTSPGRNKPERSAQMTVMCLFD